MSQRVKKSLTITAVLFALTIIIIVSSMFVLRPIANEDIEVRATLYGEDGTLQTGKYYLNGDKNSYYYEIFEDRTMQFGGGDPYEFFLMYNEDFIRDDPDDPLYDAFWNFIKEGADSLAIREKYLALTVEISAISHYTTTIYFDIDSVEQFEEYYFGRAYLVIDENTFQIRDDFRFIRVDS
ncbi:MAG: hypothetical protein FWG70_08905 [Oscillospiraceae bacterium]|nr:hypothetical protein [Oscillospiraceae bacterium]